MLKFEVNGKKETCSLRVKGKTKDLLLELCGAIESIVFAIHKDRADDPDLMQEGAVIATAAALAVRNGINRAKQHAKEAQHEAENG